MWFEATTLKQKAMEKLYIFLELILFHAAFHNLVRNRSIQDLFKTVLSEETKTFKSHVAKTLI